VKGKQESNDHRFYNVSTEYMYQTNTRMKRLGIILIFLLSVMVAGAQKKRFFQHADVYGSVGFDQFELTPQQWQRYLQITAEPYNINRLRDLTGTGISFVRDVRTISFGGGAALVRTLFSEHPSRLLRNRVQWRVALDVRRLSNSNGRFYADIPLGADTTILQKDFRVAFLLKRIVADIGNTIVYRIPFDRKEKWVYFLGVGAAFSVNIQSTAEEEINSSNFLWSTPLRNFIFDVAETNTNRYKPKPFNRVMLQVPFGLDIELSKTNRLLLEGLYTYTTKPAFDGQKKAEPGFLARLAVRTKL
jgi:hypothetical protein